MRRRRQFAVGGALLLLLLIYFAFFSGGSSAPPRATPPTTHHAVATAEHFPRHSPLNPAWTGNGHTVTLGFGGDVHFAGAVGGNLAKDPSTALGTTIPQLFAGTQAADGEPRDRGDRRHLPGAPEQALHLRRARLGRHRPQERHGLGGHRGQRPRHGLWPARPVPESDHRLPGRLPHHRHRQHGCAGLHALSGDDRRPAHRDHRGDAGDRRQPGQHVDGDRRPSPASPRRSTRRSSSARSSRCGARRTP